MLAAAAGWGARRRPRLPAAGDLGRRDGARRGRRDPARLPARRGRPGDRAALRPGGEGRGSGSPARSATPSPRRARSTPDAAGAVLVGGGVGVAPLALLRRRFSERGVPHRVLLGFRDRAHTGGLDLFCGSSGALCPEVRLATEDGHAGVQGRVTDLLLPILAGDDAASGVVYTCGPPAMLEAVRALCAEHGVAGRAGAGVADGLRLRRLLRLRGAETRRRLPAPLRRRPGPARRRRSRR